MKSHPGVSTVLPIALCLSRVKATMVLRPENHSMTSYLYRGLAPVCLGAAIPAACGTIYKSFAQCLLSLGDSLVETQKDQNTQDIDSICRSWNAFHVCASAALAGCPGEAAAIWESLRQESRKTQFSGNLYDMCASRTTLPPSAVPTPQSSVTSDQMNKETLKGQTHRLSPTSISMLLPGFIILLVSLRS